MPTVGSSLHAILWRQGKVMILDQTRLPREEVWLELGDYHQVVTAIREMRVRGAPAIGVAGTYAVALAAQRLAREDVGSFLQRLEEAAREIAGVRPTGANLAWAVHRVMEVARRTSSPAEAAERLVAEALRLQEEDEEANRRMARLGADLLPWGVSVLTHCNTGALATGGYGTALGVVRTAWAEGRLAHVFATETRPLLQGARLTAWELVREGIPATLLPDAAAGEFLRRGEVGAVLVGADRIVANGDVANKIGTYTLAVLARESGVPFYVAAPTSTFDLSLPSGEAIPLEERPPEEVTHVAGTRVVAEGIGIRNLAFDITPHRYVTAIVTERGVAREPYDQSLARLQGLSRG